MTRPVRLLVPAVVLAALLIPAATAAAATGTTTGTTTTVKAAATVTVGAPTTLVATIRPTTSTGTVRFATGGTSFAGCARVAVTSGKAQCRTTFTSTTPVTVIARFTGTGGADASSGQVVVTATDGTAGQVVGGVGTCTKKSGALVAVSYGAWGGPIVRGCDPTPTTGIELLTTAGFTTTGTQHDGPQFLCRIGHPYWKSGAQYPTPADEACVNTPPADAYWSYWLASPGKNTWRYSPLGAYSDEPVAGEVEAWTFGATDIGGTTGQPTFTPNQIRAGLPAS